MSMPSAPSEPFTAAQTGFGAALAKALNAAAPKEFHFSSKGGAGAGALIAVWPSPDEIRALKPDGDLEAVLLGVKAGSLLATSQGDGAPYDFVSRFFAPHFGVPEDPVTGSAHTALTPFWAKRLGAQKAQGAPGLAARRAIFCVRMMARGSFCRVLARSISPARSKSRAGRHARSGLSGMLPSVRFGVEAFPLVAIVHDPVVEHRQSVLQIVAQQRQGPADIRRRACGVRCARCRAPCPIRKCRRCPAPAMPGRQACSLSSSGNSRMAPTNSSRTGSSDLSISTSALPSSVGLEPSSGSLSLSFTSNSRAFTMMKPSLSVGMSSWGDLRRASHEKSLGFTALRRTREWARCSVVFFWSHGRTENRAPLFRPMLPVWLHGRTESRAPLFLADAPVWSHGRTENRAPLFLADCSRFGRRRCFRLTEQGRPPISAAGPRLPNEVLSFWKE